MRAVLTVRHPRSVERSFANLDAFLGLSRAWDTRGLKSFADELRRRREENARQAEGRPDSGGDAVSIVTIHSSKGLEWPIVIPANCITTVVEQSGPVLQRAAGKDSLLLRIFGEEIEGFQQAQALEREERARECHRLLYVADTRARDLLVIPKLSTEPKGRTWASLCPGRRDGLGDLDITLWADPVRFQKQKDTCAESREAFQECSRSIVAATRKIVRITPSRHETESEEPFLSSFDLEVVGPDEEQVAAPPVAGSSTRGILLHKLMEELLTGELEDANVTVRAAELIAELGAKDIAPRELADTISRTRAIPEVAALWPDLIPEFDVGSFNPANGELRIGVIDAGTIVAEKLDVVVDWKSDVAPAPDAVAAYAGQVREYLKSSGARRGLIVLMTPGTVVPVEP
jgi:exodeoxyribonuclease-5